MDVAKAAGERTCQLHNFVNNCSECSKKTTIRQCQNLVAYHTDQRVRERERTKREEHDALEGRAAKRKAVTSIDAYVDGEEPVEPDTLTAYASSNGWTLKRRVVARRHGSKRARSYAEEPTMEEPAESAAADARVLALEERLAASLKGEERRALLCSSLEQQVVDLKAELAVEHGKLLAERGVRRAALKAKSRARAIAPDNHGYSKAESQVSTLRSAKKEADAKITELADLVATLKADVEKHSDAASKLKQIQVLKCERVGAGVGSKVRGSRPQYPRYFLLVALQLLVHVKDPKKIRAALRIFQMTWLPFLGYENFEIPELPWWRKMQLWLRRVQQLLNSWGVLLRRGGEPHRARH